jgi:hypothetical protein
MAQLTGVKVGKGRKEIPDQILFGWIFDQNLIEISHLTSLTS